MILYLILTDMQSVHNSMFILVKCIHKTTAVTVTRGINYLKIFNETLTIRQNKSEIDI